MKGGPRYTITSLQVAAKMWPTPCAEDAKNVPYQKGKNGHRYPMLYGAVNPAKMWPTPTAVTNTDGAAMCKWGGSGARAKLRTMTSSQELNGALNPTWVEWLMGFPLGWTACAAWGTRSSRRSRNGSGGRF
jgi:DNA (cytosine-5)-methyltransferase 1